MLRSDRTASAQRREPAMAIGTCLSALIRGSYEPRLSRTKVEKRQDLLQFQDERWLQRNKHS